MALFLLTCFLAFTIGVAIMLFLPNSRFRKFFEMEHLPDSAYRKKRKNYSNGFVFLGALFLELMILIAK